MDQQTRGAVSFADVGNGFRDLAFAGDIADHGVRVGKLLLQRADSFRRPGHRNDAKSFAREAPDNRGSGAGTDPGNYGNGFVSHRSLARTSIVGTGFASAHQTSVAVALY